VNLACVYVLAFVFDVAGVGLLLFELREANSRWTSFKGRSRTVEIGPARTLEQALPLRVIRGDQSHEIRIRQLEDAVYDQRSQIADMHLRLWRHANDVAETAAGKVERNLGREVEAVIGYLLGLEERSRWRPWWLGPALVAAGILLGTVGNLASV
jgi:hypothetical protein